MGHRAALAIAAGLSALALSAQATPATTAATSAEPSAGRSAEARDTSPPAHSGSASPATAPVGPPANPAPTRGGGQPAGSATEPAHAKAEESTERDERPTAASTANTTSSASSAPTSDSSAGSSDQEPPLDLPLVNADGELAGGVHPELPTHGPTLERMVRAARDGQTPPRRYAALLWQHRLVQAADAAGIALDRWAPARGVEENESTVYAVYSFYGERFLARPELQWAGMANMIGPSFAGGFLDLDSLGRLSQPLREKLAEQPREVRDELPAEARQLAARGDRLSEGELAWFESTFLAMQKHIFMDQGAMHMAYLDGGVRAVQEMRAAGLVDDKAVTAWRDIASAQPERVRRGNTALLDREQNQIIPEQWDAMYQRHQPVGPLLTYGMTVAGSASIPGTKTPGQYAPLSVTGPVTGAQLSTPLPEFNIADRERRWRYITEDTLPAYQRLLRRDPAEVRRIVSSPVEERVAEQRLSARWPQLAEHLLTGWRLELPASGDSAPPGEANREGGEPAVRSEGGEPKG